MSKSKAKSVGAAMIAQERRRQVAKERWTAEHDAQHDNNELIRAAIAYAMPHDLFGISRVGMWPWGNLEWKPTDRVRDLVKAGALIAAELDRINEANNLKRLRCNFERISLK